MEEQVCEEDLGVAWVGLKAPGDSPMQMSTQRLERPNWSLAKSPGAGHSLRAKGGVMG